MDKEILVLGCGVSGLSTGILLLQSGYSVTIWAKDLPPNTTSNKAAAIWYPYLCFPRDKAIPWAKEAFAYFQQHMISDSKSGCVYRTITELFTIQQPEPWWKDAVPFPVERPTSKELPKGYVDGYKIKSIVIDTSIYMEYLVDLFVSLGGHILQKEIQDIQKAFEINQTVVNCTGLGSRTLFNDDKMYPVRGQMIRVKASGFDQAIVDDDGPNSLALVIPRVSDIMLGGTAQINNWNTDIDPKDTADILAKARLLWPEVSGNEIIEQSVGLRPARSEVRLEIENFDKNVVIHNYGHGGAGFTLSWGCAQDVVRLVNNLD